MKSATNWKTADSQMWMNELMKASSRGYRFQSSIIFGKGIGGVIVPSGRA
jgi:hypothetical protein